MFVSHLWERDHVYWRLVGVLKSILGSALVDHSIPTSGALKLMSCGPQALEEERALQSSHITFCEERLRLELERQTQQNRELDAMRSRMVEGRAGLAAQASLLGQERRVSEPIAHGIGQRQLPSEISYLEELRNRAAQAPTIDDMIQLRSVVSAKESELRATQARTESLREEIYSRRCRLNVLEQQHQDPSIYNEHQHVDVLMRAIRDPRSIARKHPNLALAIFERIRSSDIVFMLVGATDMYREWMELESELVTDLGKAIIVVRPKDEIAPPPEMLRYSKRDSVSIDPAPLFGEIRHLVADPLPWHETMPLEFLKANPDAPS